MRFSYLIVIGLMLGVVGCQTTGQSIDETGIDEKLTVQPVPSVSLPGTVEDEPRQSFEQEPSE